MDDKYSIQVLERAFNIMEALLQAGEPLSLEAVMTRTGMAKSTAFRILSNLVRYGYVIETDGGVVDALVDAKVLEVLASIRGAA